MYCEKEIRGVRPLDFTLLAGYTPDNGIKVVFVPSLRYSNTLNPSSTF